MELTDTGRRFVLHWGEMGSAWGVNRTVAQIHALLFFHGRPLSAEEISDTLSLARSNVSNSLKELQTWTLVRRVQMHEMLSPASFWRKRFRFMRMHYQFVMANERRAAYDYFMLACGPISLLPTAHAPAGPVDLFGADGSALANKEAAR